MMRHRIASALHQAVEQLVGEGVLPTRPEMKTIKVERPREKGHGDFATNAALLLAKPARMNPRELAARLVPRLLEVDGVEKVESAGPGFVNLFITAEAKREIVREVLAGGEAFGRSETGRGERVMVEFVSANPTGPMHVGHGRGACVGDAIARLLTATGHEVSREYYINDAGVQMATLGRSLLARYREAFGHEVALPEGGYPGEYVKEIAQLLKERDGDLWLAASGDLAAPPPEEVVDFAIAVVLKWIREDLARLNIVFDHWFSERTLHASGAIAKAVAFLEARDLIYRGVLEPPKGKKLDDWEPRPQLLFRSTRFGDDVDRALQKSDGAFTYFAADIAYHKEKLDRGFQRLVNVWGADHGGYVKRVEAAVEAFAGEKGRLDVRLVQMVSLLRGGQPVRMSKRSGTFETLADLVAEVGSDAVRFGFLTRASDSQLEFDLDLAVSKSNDNPVFYVQYAHARVISVREKLLALEGAFPDRERLSSCDLSPLAEPEEMALCAWLDRFPEVVESAALMREPHQVAYFLQDLAAAFHAYYNSHRILEEDPALRLARLALVNAVGQVIRNGLFLLGVEAPERM